MGGPLYVGICGKVFDVTSSKNFNPSEGYGQLWGGKDATHAMATLSLEPGDANKFDWSIDKLSEQELKNLGSWHLHFSTKYEQKGTLKEYEGRCFDKAYAAAPAEAPKDIESL